MCCARLGVLLVVLVSCVGAAKQPNIVLILADDMGWNDVGFHGSSQISTPNIDALAYQGLILNRHYTLPTCSPSRAALLSGRYPIHTGLQKPIAAGTTEALPLNHTLLPEHLRRLGYQTHLVGKWHLGSHKLEYWPTNRGFQSHFGYLNGYLGYFDGIHINGNLTGIDARRNEEEAWQEFAGHYITDLLTEESVSVIQRHNESAGPLFLEVALSAPHTGNPGCAMLQVRDELVNDADNSYISDTHRRLYAGMVEGVDDAVGSIVTALKTKGLLEDSVVMFSADNGAPSLDLKYFYNNSGSNWPLRGSKASCHEGGVRSAAALWSSLVPGGRVFDQLIHISDWLPTLYSAAGGNVSDLGVIDGVNQWYQLTSAEELSAARTEAVVDLSTLSNNEALIKWPWKLVKYTSLHPELNVHAGDSGRGAEVPEYSVARVLASPAAQALDLVPNTTHIMALRDQADISIRCPLVLNGTTPLPCDEDYCLFNLQTDPCETQDLASSLPSVVATLRVTLEGYRSTMLSPVSAYTSERANPSLWANYWSAWDTSASVSVSVTPSLLLVAGVVSLIY